MFFKNSTPLDGMLDAISEKEKLDSFGACPSHDDTLFSFGASPSHAIFPPQ
jgi:hypothetical protein